MKTRILNTVIALAALVSLSVSCQREDLLLPGGDALTGYVNLSFNVQVPEMEDVQTKAVDPDGGGVQQISVFCFDKNGLFITVVTAKVKGDGGKQSLSGTFDISVPDYTETVQLVGNQNLTYFREDNYRGMSEVDVMTTIEASAGRMIYWARKTLAELAVPNPATVKLLRNQAKITLEVDEKKTNFVASGWVVVNTNAFGTVAPYSPEHGGFVAPSVETPFVTLPDNRAKLGDFLDVRTTAEEYVFETENTASDPVDFIVKGSQDGGEQLYYRVSLIDVNGDHVMIMRNHHYTVNIVGDLYYGQPTFQQALEAPATNNVWVSISDNISKVQDSEYSLEVEKTSVVIGETEFKDPNVYYLHYTLSSIGGGALSAPEVSWMDGNNVALSNFSHTFDKNTGEGTIVITLNQMGSLQKREGTIFVKSGRLSRKIKVVTIKQQNFEPAWITTNIYGSDAGSNVTMMFTVSEDSPAELFPMDVLVTVNDMDVRNASGMVLPVITDQDPRYGEDNGIGYKYVLTVTQPGKQRVYLKTIINHEVTDVVRVTVEAPHFKSITKSATFQTDIDARILINNLRSYVGAMPADEYIYYYLVPQKVNAEVEFTAHLGKVVQSAPASGKGVTLTNPLGVKTHFEYISPQVDFDPQGGYNVDEFLLYSKNLEHNHSKPAGSYYFDFYKDLDQDNWAPSGGRVLGFYRNTTTGEPGQGAILHLRTTTPKSDEVVRIASNVYGAPSITSGVKGEKAAMDYMPADGKCTGEGTYKSCIFEIATFHPFHFAATVNGQGTNVMGQNEEVVDDVLLSYIPDQSINIEFDVTSFTSTIRGNDGSILPDSEQVSVDPFGTAFDIYIDAPMLELDKNSDLYKSGKVEKHPTIAGRFVYHVDASRDAERNGSLEATKDSKATVSQAGERKRISFKTKGIVSAGDIVISSDESKVVFYQKRFRIHNSSMTGTIPYRKDGKVENVPAGAFVPFEVDPTYNRIGTVTIGEDGKYELRLRSEYKYDWLLDKVKFQYVDGDTVYEKQFGSLSALNSSTGPIILEPQK